jgi:hypothetical protein
MEGFLLREHGVNLRRASSSNKTISKEVENEHMKHAFVAISVAVMFMGLGTGYVYAAPQTRPAIHKETLNGFAGFQRVEYYPRR